MFSSLTPKSAREEPDWFLISVMNECRPESGAYLAAKDELARRKEIAGYRRKFVMAILLGLVGIIFWLVRRKMSA